MSNDLRDLFKKELDQIPLRPAETWVPERRRAAVGPGLAWRAPLALIGAIVILVVAVIGGRQLAAFRNQTAATSGVVAGKALYLSPSFNGSGWIQIDPENLKDVSSKPLLDIAPSSTNSSETQVSADGSTIIVSDFSGSTVTRRVFDGRTGQLRGYFVPEVAMVLDYLSADGTLGLGRVGDNRSSLTGENVLVTIPEGHVLRHLFAMDIPGTIQRVLASPDLSTRYYVTTSTAADPGSTAGLQPLTPYSLYVRSTTDQLSGPIALPGITGGTEATGATPRTVRPAIAMGDDGRRLAALSTDGGTLDLVDVKTLAVTTLSVHKKTSLLDPFRPLVAQAKTLNDEEQRAMVFTPDGSAVISWVTQIHYDDLNGPNRTTRDIERIDVATGLITAANSALDGIYGLTVSPDGQNIYLIVRTQEPPSPLYVLRRLDARSLELKVERTLPDYVELQVLAAPAPAPTIATATPPTRTQAPVGCPQARLQYLVEGSSRCTTPITPRIWATCSRPSCPLRRAASVITPITPACRCTSGMWGSCSRTGNSALPQAIASTRTP